MISFQCQAIKTLWSTIEPFLDLPSVVSTSRACTALHGETIDAESGRIKVSRVNTDPNYTFGQRDWDRIPNLLPYMLNSIHWPSVRRITLSFPCIVPVRPDLGIIESSTPSCFPILVSQLVYANNLESLAVCFDEILDNSGGDENEDGNTDNIHMRYEPLLALFGSNLARCTKLKAIDISSDEYCSFMLRELFLALTPTFVKQRDVMEKVQLFCNCPRDVEESDIAKSLHAASVELFGIILRCSKLRVLDICIPHSLRLTAALFQSADQISRCMNHSFKKRKVEAAGWSDLHRLSLCLWGMYEIWTDDVIDQHAGRANAFLTLFSRCANLEDVKLGLHSEVWQDGYDQVTNFLRRQPKLSALIFYFGGYKDSNGKVVRMLKESVMEGDKLRIGDMMLHDLNNAPGDKVYKLAKGIQMAGGHFTDWVEMHGGELRDEVPDFKESLAVEDVPEAVDINRVWLRHGMNFSRRERDLGPWY